MECEASLLEGLNDEVGQMYGVSATYILKQDATFDFVFGEDIAPKFKYSFDIGVMPLDQTIDLGKAQITPYGVTIDAMPRFQVGAELLIQRIKALNLKDRAYPNPGDLLYIPQWKTLFQINFANQRIKNQLGKFPVFELTCQIYDHNDAKFETGNTNIDGIQEYIKEEEKYRSNEVVNAEQERLVANETYPDEWDNFTNKNKLNDLFVKE